MPITHFSVKASVAFPSSRWAANFPVLMIRSPVSCWLASLGGRKKSTSKLSRVTGP